MISAAELHRLFELYDRFHGALDPLDPATLEAETAFFDLLHPLHAAHAPDLPFDEFRRFAVHQCKEYLRKN